MDYYPDQYEAEVFYKNKKVESLITHMNLTQEQKDERNREKAEKRRLELEREDAIRRERLRRQIINLTFK